MKRLHTDCYVVHEEIRQVQLNYSHINFGCQVYLQKSLITVYDITFYNIIAQIRRECDEFIKKGYHVTILIAGVNHLLIYNKK